MAVKVGDTIEPLGSGGFPVVDASHISGLADVATTGSYSDLNDKPNVGSNTLPVYFDNGTATAISNLSLTSGDVTAYTLHANSDFFTSYVTSQGKNLWIGFNDNNNEIYTSDDATFTIKGSATLGRDGSSDTVTINAPITVTSDTITATNSDMSIATIKPDIIYSGDSAYCRTEYDGFPFYTEDDIFVAQIDPNSTTSNIPHSISGTVLKVTSGDTELEALQVGGTPSMGSSTSKPVFAVKGWMCIEGDISGKDPNVSNDNSVFYVYPANYTNNGQKTLGTATASVTKYNAMSQTGLRYYGNTLTGKPGERHVNVTYGDVGAFNTSNNCTAMLLGHGNNSGGEVRLTNSSGTQTIDLIGSTGSISASSVAATTLTGLLSTLYSSGVGGLTFLRIELNAKPSSMATIAIGTLVSYSSSNGYWTFGSYHTASSSQVRTCGTYYNHNTSSFDYYSTATANTSYQYRNVIPIVTNTNSTYLIGFFMRVV